MSVPTEVNEATDAAAQISVAPLVAPVAGPVAAELTRRSGRNVRTQKDQRAKRLFNRINK